MEVNLTVAVVVGIFCVCGCLVVVVGIYWVCGGFAGFYYYYFFKIWVFGFGRILSLWLGFW